MTLPDHNGEKVVRALARVTKTGDSLSEPLALTPEPFDPKKKHYLLFEVEVEQENHKRRTPSNGEQERTWDFVQTLVPVRFASIALKDAKPHLDKAEDELRKKRDSMEGQEALKV
jgi:hypothetical protein